MAEAKIRIGMDIKPLTEGAKKARKALEELGNVHIEGNLGKSLRQVLVKDLNSQAKILNDTIKRTEVVLLKLAASNREAFKVERIKKFTQQLIELKKEANALSKIRIHSIGGGATASTTTPTAETPQVGGGMGLGGLLRSPAGKILGALGLGFGISSALNRAKEQAEVGLHLRQMTGGAMVEDQGRWGFTRMERRERALNVGAAAGQNLSSEELTRRVNVGEMFERAFNVNQEQFGGALGAARKAGVGDQTKFVASAIGDAVADGLTGSSIGEYLSSMTSYMESMSKGVDIDEKSLRGFASSMGSLEFFKRDPSRIFDALQGIEQAFKGGNEYQQYLTYRTMSQSMPNAGPAGIELRRRMGLTGTIDKGAARDLRAAGMGGLAETMSAPGGQMIEDRARMAFKDIEGMGMDPENAMLKFSEAMGLTPGQAAPIFARFARQRKEGRSIDKLSLSKGQKSDIERAMKKPEDQAKENMKTFEGAVKTFSTRIDTLENKFADLVGKGFVELTAGIDKFSDATGMFKSDVEKLGIVVAAAAGVTLLKSGGGLSGGGGKGLLGPTAGILSSVWAGNEIGNLANEYLDSTGASRKIDDFLGGGFGDAGKREVEGMTPQKTNDWLKESKKRKIPYTAESAGQLLELERINKPQSTSELFDIYEKKVPQTQTSQPAGDSSFKSTMDSNTAATQQLTNALINFNKTKVKPFPTGKSGHPGD